MAGVRNDFAWESISSSARFIIQERLGAHLTFERAENTRRLVGTADWNGTTFHIRHSTTVSCLRQRQTSATRLSLPPSP